MKIISISWKNIQSFGNKLQTVELSDEGGLWMVVGRNGVGKCHAKTTKLIINIENEDVRKKFIDFLKK